MLQRSKLLVLALTIGSCAPQTERAGRGSRDLAPAGGDEADLGMEGDVYGDLGVDTMCKPPQKPTLCPSSLAANAGGGLTELCGTGGAGNGLDDNCNGQVDEGCTCRPGDVEKCFLGPPGKQHIGACTDGLATCTGQEFGSWGPCMG